jgi:hypothetical protein
VSQQSFSENTFDLVTAVETHFWWPDLSNDIGEVLRVPEPSGKRRGGAPPSETAGFDAARYSSAGRLEEFYGVSRGIIQQDF